MTDMNPYEKMTERQKTITIDGKKYPIQPKVKDFGAFIAMGKEAKGLTPKDTLELDELKSQKLAETMVEILHRPVASKATKDQIDEVVAGHYTDVLKELTIAMGLASEKDFKKPTPLV